MKTLSEHIENPLSEEMLIQSMAEVLMIAFNEDNINESIFSGEDTVMNEGVTNKINSIMSKGGLHVKKTKGIIGHLMAAGKGIGKLFVALIKKDTEGAKQVLKGLKKEDVLDFLLDLDMATNHTISGPIHWIDAWTGWHLWANVTQKVRGAQVAVKDAIAKLKMYISNVYTKVKAKVYTKYIIQMEKDLQPA